MIQIGIHYNLFTRETYKSYYRDGQLIGYANGREVHRNPETRAENEITRAQAYRYWKHNFKDRCCWTLPEPLQEALDKPVKTYGSYWNERLQEEVGYEG